MLLSKFCYNDDVNGVIYQFPVYRVIAHLRPLQTSDLYSLVLGIVLNSPSKQALVFQTTRKQ